jgi:predicted nucleic acid-binding protein
MTERALEIASVEKISTYDSLYLALAVQAQCRLITADRRLVEQVHRRDLKKHLVGLTDALLQREIAETKM